MGGFVFLCWVKNLITKKTKMSPLAEATARIDAAIQENSNRLDLSQLGLKVLPPNFGQIAPALITLNLRDNKFQSVPPELGLCIHLQNALIFLLSINTLDSPAFDNQIDSRS